ncbi:hypothetical protein LK08_30835 [Streptomyces sp. MUSC 125]|uniref:hypothetical protein n=1 Tax=Streptomyces TaxID=1883 RepID=UPI0005742344|nr:hypothetical protein LK08_30835 [Streptomyces sp. MUSC 125]MCH0560825.1 hypothetical protein [Streptomyces sp. MUM 16J]
MRLPSRAAAKALVAAVLPLALAACSVGFGSAGPGLPRQIGRSAESAGSGSSPSRAAEPVDPNAGLLTGTELQKALAPALSFCALSGCCQTTVTECAFPAVTWPGGCKG